jgi:hypothetical protein
MVVGQLLFVPPLTLMTQICQLPDLLPAKTISLGVGRPSGGVGIPEMGQSPLAAPVTVHEVDVVG